MSGLPALCLEKVLREKKISPEEIKQLRHEHALPIINEMHAWLKENSMKVRPKALSAKPCVTPLINGRISCIILMMDGWKSTITAANA